MLEKKEGFEDYLSDAGNMSGGNAERLFLPESTEEIAEILRKANRSGGKITVSGARTGTVGGAVPFGGSVISLEKLNKIMEIDKERRAAVVESGVILRDLQKAADASGLFYPPDPTEWSCQIGGTVATNASGARSFKYGSTRDRVRRLKIVLPTGDRIELTRGEIFSDGGSLEIVTEQGNSIRTKVPTYPPPDVRKNTCGYFSGDRIDAIDLFIGSEGTLGIISEVELGLLPKPEGALSGIVFFPSDGDLLELVSEVRDRSFRTREPAVPGGARSDPLIDATLLEYFDANSLRFVSERFREIPAGASGAVFFEQETTGENEEGLFGAWNALFERHNAALGLSWFSVTETDLERMREFRHALPVAVNERVVKNGQRKIGTDMALPDRNFESFLNYSRARLEESGLVYVIFGHIGDCHLHVNLLPKNETEAVRARHLYGRFIAEALMLGGTVSAEHGIGKLKAKYLEVMYGERYLNEMAKVKRSFDPGLILGIGNMLGQKYLEG